MFPGKHPWELRLRYPFDEALKNELKAYPGIQWRKAAWGGFDWHAPQEALEFLRDVSRSHGYALDTNSLPVRGLPGPAPVLHEKLWPFQREHVTKALERLPHEGAFILNNEMGLGKSPEALEILRNLPSTSAVARHLILCPAMVREDWSRKIDEWWPNHPPVAVVRDGKQAAKLDPQAGIVLTSYGLVPKLPELAYDAVVFDELHYLQGESAARTLACERLLRRQTAPPVALGLTGTLISNTPLSMWKPLDVLFPGRFGTRNQFGARYCRADATGFGNSYYGADVATAPELRARLARFSARSSKKDPGVSELLPPFLVRKAWTNKRQRLETASQLVLDALENGVNHAVVLTHRRDLAREIATAIAGRIAGVETGHADGVPVRIGVVTGELPPVARDRLLREIAQVPRSVLCATMHSVGIGIDLTWAEEVVLAELDYSPTAVLQALGRFSRLSGRRGVGVTVLLAEGSDPVGDAIAAKVQAANLLVDAGQAESAAADFAAGRVPLTDVEMDALLRDMAAVMEEE